MESRFANPGDVGHFLHYGGSGGTHELDHDFVIVDVETSGLDPAAGARVIEIAAVRINQAGQIQDSMSTLINPEDGNTGAIGSMGSQPTWLLRRRLSTKSLMT
jgi:DNA polymerase III epsilon subunit-like protein